MDGHISGDRFLALLACGKPRGLPLPQVKGNKIVFHMYKINGQCVNNGFKKTTLSNLPEFDGQ